MRLSVIGIGNSWASDDGVGPKAIALLEASWTAGNLGPVRQRAIAGHQETEDGQKTGAQVAFIKARQADIGLLDVLASSDDVILIDAVSSGAAPGTIHRQAWRPNLLTSRGVERASSHGLGVKELLELAGVLDKLPRRIQLWGVEAGSTEPGDRLSPLVEATLPKLVEHLSQAIDAAVCAVQPAPDSV